MVLAQQPPEVQDAIRHHRGGDWPDFASKRRALYPYTPDMAAVPVECAPLRTTDIQLEPGETVTGVAMGDSERWMATPAASGDPTNPTPHIVVKPQMAGLATDLTIFTTHHIYRLSLRSRPGGAKQSVSFYFPDEILTAMRAADTAPARNDPTNTLVADSSARLAGSPNAADPTAPTVDPSRLNFAYQINGPALPWRPTRVFDDGTRTWIEMPPSTSPIAPALLGDNHAALNYRVIGNHYVVDGLFSEAELVAGVGRQQDRVTISRVASTGPSNSMQVSR
jgi:type IV secretion system protein VirB9